MTRVGTAGPNRQLWLAAAVPTAFAGFGLAWLLARPDTPPPSSLLRVVADCAGVLAVGLACVNRLDDPRRRAELRNRARLPLIGTGAVWLLAVLGLAVGLAAESAGVGYGRLDLGTLGSYLTQISTGRLMLLVAASVAVLLVSSAAARIGGTDRPLTVELVCAALALVVLPLTGHLSQRAPGAVFALAHTLSAALWCGLLAAMALTVRSRGAWARTLPRYSAVALWSVAVLVVSGVVDAALQLDGFGALVATGYGRILVAKTVILVGLLGAGWRFRRGWVEQAAAHRTSSALSLRRAVAEVAVMAVVLGLAAALATVG
ncbi:copper resistance protein CopD [Rhodococcus sp. D2-41]|uniref:CopD family protein n=1 Tax=Speluncibacter jeojiensis TaxID=2710754 RepID=A0A9X4LZV8_9ACTN|nr:CopD family protein [Rhodococcus sp. D2-41]MDG3010530.1 copper resistance protein CopD [Rhodococcus sp. D2-41]MDG3014279.1 CopD family protein [Corynebacteriales bacterium D3-21]